MDNQTLENRGKTEPLAWDSYILISVNALLFLVGSFMNFVSLVYFGFHGKRCRSNYRYFIAHLSFADLLCCLLTPFFFVLMELNGGNWILGEFTCKYIYTLGRITGNSSAWILCGMTYERYRAFTDPFRKLHKRNIQIFLAVVWIISGSFSMLYSVTGTQLTNGKCITIMTRAGLMLDLAKINIKITVPSIIMTVLYIRLKLFLNNQNKERQDKLQSRIRTDKSEKMILYSAITYLVCVLPTMGMATYLDVITLDQGKTARYQKVFQWLLVLFYANSVINVFIYAGKFKDFRKFIFEKLRTKKVRQKRQMRRESTKESGMLENSTTEL